MAEDRYPSLCFVSSSEKLAILIQNKSMKCKLTEKKHEEPTEPIGKEDEAVNQSSRENVNDRDKWLRYILAAFADQ